MDLVDEDMAVENVQQIKINHEPIREKLRVDQLNTLDGTFRLLWQERTLEI